MDWQPIEKAKRDGTEYIGRLGPKKFRLVWYWKVSSRTEGWCDENGKRVHPTHFLPKPADPH